MALKINGTTVVDDSRNASFTGLSATLPSTINTTSTSAALTITQLGTGNALVVEDATSDTTPFVVDQSGNVSVGGTLAVTGNATITGDLTVNGTTTTVNSSTYTVDDPNITIGAVTTPTDVTADGGGITLKGATDKTINWVNATSAWTSSEHLNLLTGKAYYINGTSVLSTSALGSGVTSSSLTSVGTITSGVWNGTTIAVANGGTGATTLTGLVVGNGTSAMTTVTAPSGTVVGTTDTQTLTNKRITSRVYSITGAAGGAITPTSDTADQYNITALGATASFSAPSGTKTDGQKLSIRIYSAAAQTISWTVTSTGYRVIGTTLPLLTGAGKTIYVGCIWNATDSFWDVVAVATEA